jgi:hypothetical protein
MKTISRITAAAIITVSAIAIPAAGNATVIEASNLPIDSKAIIMPTGYSWDISQWFCRTYGAMCPR